jgi:hypothetical protein
MKDATKLLEGPVFALYLVFPPFSSPVHLPVEARKRPMAAATREVLENMIEEEKWWLWKASR